MRTILQRIVRGCRYSDYYGSHPGTPILCAFVAIGAVAGGWIGVAIMGAVFGPLYSIGAYERGLDDE